MTLMLKSVVLTLLEKLKSTKPVAEFRVLVSQGLVGYN